MPQQNTSNELNRIQITSQIREEKLSNIHIQEHQILMNSPELD